MSEPIFSNDDAEIILVDETMGVIDTTRRPVSEARRKAILKQLEKEAELRKLMDQRNPPISGEPPRDNGDVA